MVIESFLSIVLQVRIKNFKLESLFFDFCHTTQIETLIDVGSNRPENGEIFKKHIGSSKFYYAFEANPITYNYYFKEFSENFIFSNLAIGSKNGFISINVPESPSLKSSNRIVKGIRSFDKFIFKNYHSNLQIFHTASNLGGSEKWHISTTKKFKVPVVRLDNLFLKFENFTALWIDVEGSTVEVLEGLGNLLDSEKLIAVFIESEDFADSIEKWKLLNSYKKLVEFGFQLVYFSEISNGMFVRPEFVEVLTACNPNLILRKHTQKRRVFKLRLKSLFYKGDKFFAEW